MMSNFVNVGLEGFHEAAMSDDDIDQVRGRIGKALLSAFDGALHEEIERGSDPLAVLDGACLTFPELAVACVGAICEGIAFGEMHMSEDDFGRIFLAMSKDQMAMAKHLARDASRQRKRK